MDNTSTSKYVVETQSAIDNVNRLSKAYIENNQALGGLISQFGLAKQNGKSVYSTFVQINESGQKVTTTVRETGDKFSVLAVKVQAATRANKELAAQQLAVAAATERANAASIKITPDNQGELSARFKKAPGTGLLASAVRRANELNLNLAKGNALLGLLNTSSERVQIAPNLNKAKVAISEVNEGFKQLEGTLHQISKIALATVIYRGLSLLQQGISGSIASASEYYRQLALVQTLADKGGDSFETWAGAVEKLSKELAVPVTQVASAAYDGLSNQVIKSTADFDLLRQSFILAKTTGSDAGDSLNLLSSIINGFSRSAAEGSDIADKLFTTVDLGNVKLQELKDTIGRSASLSKTLGVSFEELAAGIAVITQTGVGAAEATTLLNNIFVQLIKPNEKLQQALLDLGFQTGQSAIETLKFSGVLGALGEKAKSTADGLATFFPEIRGLRGVAALSGTELVKFDKTLTQIENSSGRAAEALKIVSQNAGQKFADEIERVKTFFTADIGTGFLNGLIQVTDKFGGISKIVKDLTIQVGLATASIGVFVAGTRAINLAVTLTEVTQGLVGVSRVTGGLRLLLDQAAISAKGFAASFGGFVTFATIGYVAVDQLFNLIQTQSREATQKIIDDANKSASARIAIDRAANQKTIADFDRNLSDRNTLFGKYLREQVKLSTKALEEVKNKTEKVAEELRNTFDISLGIARQSITAAEQEEAKAIASVKKIREEQIKSLDEAQKDQFDASIDRAKRQRDNAVATGRNEAQVNAELGRSLGEIITLRNNLVRSKRDEAIGKGDIELAARFQNELLDNIKLFQEESITVRGVTQSLFNQADVSRLLSSAAADYNSKLENRIPLLKQEAELASGSALEQRKRVKDAEDLFKTISKFNTTVVKDGEFAPKFAEDPNKAIESLKKLQDEALKFVKNTKGIKDENLLKDLGTNLDDVLKQFNEQRRNLADIVNETQRSLSLNKAGRNRTELLEAEKKLVRELGDTLNSYTDIINKNAAAAAAGADLIKRTLETGLPPQNLASDEAKKAINTLPDVEKLRGLFENPKANLKEIEETLARINQNIGTFGGGLSSPGVLDPSKFQSVKTSLQDISTLLGNIRSISDSNTSARLSELLTQSAKTGKDDLQAQIELFNRLRNLKIELTGSKDPILPKVDEALEKIRALINALQQVKAAEAGISNFGSSGGKVEQRASGGVAGSQGGFLSDFLSGRFKKGTDIIPAMLTRGERVISAPMSEKYAATLEAIQRNRLPVYRAEGTPTGGTSVGSIVINMPRGSTAAQVREFGKQLNRGIKQGTIAL